MHQHGGKGHWLHFGSILEHIGTQGHIRGPWPLPGTGPATSRFPGGLTTAELTVGGHCGCCDQVLKALNQQAGELEAGKC